MKLLGLRGRARKDLNRKLRKQGHKLQVRDFGSRHKYRQAKRNGYAL